MQKEADVRAEVEAQNRQAAESNRQRLERALAGDLFARPMKVEASAPEPRDEPEPVAQTQAQDD